MIEGLLFQTMIQGTGLALLEMTLKALKPVRIGDTVWATVTITGIKPTSKNNRAVIDSDIAVFNTKDEQVLSYTAKRMLAGRSEEHTSELQSLMRISYAVFCLKKKKNRKQRITNHTLMEHTKHK